MSWSLMVRIKIFLVLILCTVSVFFIIRGEKISSKIVGNPPCLKGSLEERCYDGKGISFDIVKDAFDKNNNPVLLYQIVNSLPFGYINTQINFDMYAKDGTFLQAVVKKVSILPLAITYIVLELEQKTQIIPSIVIPTVVSQGTPEFVKGSKDYKAFTTSLFTMTDSKFSRSITVPIQYHGSLVPSTQNYKVVIQGYYQKKEDVYVNLVRDADVFYPEKDVPQSIITVEIPNNFNATNVSVSCVSGCLSL